jgi:O-antigen/teichoic acid export membrane protein
VASQVAAGGAWGLGGQLTVLLATVLATPFTIRLLGPSRYGTWGLLQSSLSWAALADLGMASASTKFAAERYTAGDGPGEAAVVWTSLGITVTATACTAAVVGLLAPSVLFHLLHVRGGPLGADVVALRVFCGLFVCQSVAGTINTPQVVRLRWRPYTAITQGSNLVLIVGVPVALACTSGGIVTAAAVALGAAALGAGANLVVATRLQRELLKPRARRRLLRPLLNYGGSLTLAGLAAIPLTTAERFLLALNHSTVVVAHYTVAASLGTVLAVLPQQLAGPLMPALVRLEAGGRTDEHLSLYRKSLQALFVSVTPASVLLAFLAHPFLAVWAGAQYGRYSTGPFFVVLAGLWFNALSYVPFFYLVSSGRTKTIAYIRFAELVPFIAGAALLTARFGAMGAAAAWSARVVVDCVVTFAVVHRTAGLHWSPLPARRGAAVLTAVALGGATAATAVIVHGLAPRLACAALLGAGYALLAWKVLTAEERRGLLALFGEVAPRALGRPGRLG